MIRRLRFLSCLAVGVSLTLPACAPKAGPPAVPGAPRFPDFLPPTAPADLAPAPVVARHGSAWAALQAGDLRAAEREFGAVLKEAPSFYPASAGLGYTALARKDYKDAVSLFDRALAADVRYVPALVGRGEALLAAGDRETALAAFEAAIAADPGLTALRERVTVLRFRGLQDDIAAARKAADAGRVDEARQIYERAIVASPDSPFLHRELAVVERRAGNLPLALAHAEKAAALDPNEPRSFILLGEIHEGQSDFARAAEAYAAAAALEPSDALTERIDRVQEKAAFAAMPAEYQSIDSEATVTRAQLAALLGVHLDGLLKRARRRTAVVMTDTRGHWAAPWILLVTRAGVMEPFPNHAFQPGTTIRRGDLAAAASRALALIAAEKPRLAAGWRNPSRRFTDLPPGHLSYPAAALAVEAGVMEAIPDGSFQLTRPVTGQEATAAARALKSLAESRGR
jgi:tetratricopeptide (TPR) repeat protein